MGNAMKRTCVECERRGQTWNGDAPKCAFAEGLHWSPDNWNCATDSLIRQLVERDFDDNLPRDGVTFRWCEDQKYATVDVSSIDLDEGGLTLWVSWYKRRGRTEAMWLLSEHGQPRRPTETDLRVIAKAYGIPMIAPHPLLVGHEISMSGSGSAG